MSASDAWLQTTHMVIRCCLACFSLHGSRVDLCLPSRLFASKRAYTDLQAGMRQPFIVLDCLLHSGSMNVTVSFEKNAYVSNTLR